MAAHKSPDKDADVEAPLPFSDSGLSFASLASTAPPTAGDTASGGSTEMGQFSATSATGTGPQTFFGLSKHNDFNNFKTSADQSNGNNSTGGGGGGDGEDSAYDPHYDPIIALPDEIVVSTGEEEEQKFFGERAKLYRFDVTNHEWKERGAI